MKKFINKAISSALVSVILLCSIFTCSLPIHAAESFPKIPALQISRVYQSEAASGMCYWCSMATVQGYCLGSYTYSGVTSSYRTIGKDYNFASSSDAITKKLKTFSGYANNASNLSSYPVKMSLDSSGIGNNTSTYTKIYNQLKLGKPVILYTTLPHASVVIGYNGSTTSIDPAGFTVLEVKKMNSGWWSNSASNYNSYANKPQIDSQSGSSMSCYVTLKSWLSICGTIKEICYPKESPLKYTIAYNSNGGTGSISSSTVSGGSKFTLSANKFTKSGCYFANYNVHRKSDDTWYTDSNGWQKLLAIRNNNYTIKSFSAGSQCTLNTAWTNGAKDGDTFTFYPLWKPDNPTLTFYPNYSGCNYILGGALDSKYSDYI